jgi:putative SOS response-associated peptidase YedK
MAELHDRMPAILAPAEYDAWLKDGDLNLLRPLGARCTPTRWTRRC